MRSILVQLTTSLLAVLSFSTGVYSLVRNPKPRVVRLWFLASMAVTVWAVGYVLTNTSSSVEAASVYLKVVYFGASFIPILSFHFVASFLFQEQRVKPIIILGYVCAVIFLVLTIFTTLVISGVRHLENFGRYEEITTPGFHTFVAYVLFFSSASVYLLVKDYFRSDGIRRRQIFYLALALTIGFAGAISNLVTDLTGIYPYGQMIVWLYPLLVTYGIFFTGIRIKIRF